ncbi:hypothetical protein RD792_001282 [Penstemon davidsonii]|uniref:non-specific serine/threonine protein kinase n=1 Tax=Penstemon davidsonii TaxID=160366 RepID=A0ABR0DN83_9LAMI|nr:hypothetical protein RD792_001282 [Penstemon davidsonii]
MDLSPDTAPNHNTTSPPPPPPPSPSPSPPPPTNSSSPSPSSSPTNSSSQSSPPPPPPKDSPAPRPATNNSSHSVPPTHSPPPPPNTRSSPEYVFSPPAPVVGSKTPPSASHPPPQLPHEKSPNSPTPGSDSSASDSIDPGVIVAVVVGGVVIVALLALCIMCTRRRKKPYYMDHGLPPKGELYYNGTTPWNNPQPMDHIVKLPPPPGVMGTPVGGVNGWGAPAPPLANNSGDFSSSHSGQPPSPNMVGMVGSKSQFSYEELAAATAGFAQANLLGQGGFGFVHKGVLADGKVVAVKSLKSGSGQGEREFQAEVEIISRVHHRHLVSLVGYCIADQQRMLVYEYVNNKTLEYHLHGKGRPVMDWATRLRIALGSAKGLAYLHEDCHPRIIHRDIKASNILLDYNFEAMVADFGLAKLTSDNFTHVSTRVMGTFGYLAPEYASSGKLTEKSDVFSFGVMLLELITGRRPVDPTNKTMEDSLVDWARPIMIKALEDGNYNALVDPRLEDNYVPDELARMVACASASIRHSGRRRPKMSQIVRALDGASSLEDFNEGVKPNPSAAHNRNANTEVYDTRAYDADMMKFRKMVMTSQEYNSSEYGATSEYGLNPSSSSSSNNSREMDKASPKKQ